MMNFYVYKCISRDGAGLYHAGIITLTAIEL